MSRHTHSQIDRMIRLERRGIWLCLMVILLLGAVVLLAGATHDPTLAQLARWIMSIIIPLAIVFGAVWVNRAQDGSAPESKENREAIVHDELRQVATYKAFRAGFFAMLCALAVFCLLSFVTTLIWSAGLLAATTITLGIAVFLGSFLFYDRA
ncbi:hypothetical protein P5Y53_01915 [Dyella jiangningensis]|uniref:hypothetical protein n=1 Tax=Dyella jiangningensis TaxID=1379159 RepID=UPI00241064C9|nr:hypothetical protein [Dyella jiangningensis]MDG2536414.1 hypothetical protein [Dyella jiangningensis]